MKTLAKSFLITVTLVTGLAACDVLDVQPVSQISQSNFWKTPEDASAAIIGMYDAMQDALIRMTAYGDIRTGEEMFALNKGNIINNYRDILDNNLNSANPLANWSVYYRVISRANLILQNLDVIDGLSESTRQQYRGEALFARAIAYFWIVKIWGDAPLVLEPYTTAKADFDVPRKPKREVLSQIEKDLEAAVSLLPNDYGLGSAATRGRATKGAAQALQTEVFLWIAQVENGGSTYFQKAVAAADAVIGNSLYRLNPVYSDVFFKDNTDESIFELQFSFAQNDQHGDGNTGSHSPAVITLLAPYALSDRLVVSDKHLAEAEAGDLRIEQVYVDRQTQMPGLIKFLGTSTNNPKEPNETYYDSNIVIYRLADIMLMKAEALNALGRTAEAMALVNQIRARAGLAPKTAASQNEATRAILHERRYELGYEGKYFFDLVRNGLAVEMLANTNDPRSLVWPIAETELILNPELVQNDYYR